MSSAISPNPSSGAPGTQAPNQAAYQVPDASGLQQSISNSQQMPGVAPDFTQLNQTIGQQQGFLGQLQAIANGTDQTAGQQMVAQGIQQAQTQSQGAVQAAGRGINPAEALRAQQGAQQGASMQIRAQGAQLQANQQIVAQQQAAQLMGTIQQEQYNQQQLSLQAQQSNQNFQQTALGQEFALSQMQQSANMAYQNALNQYQTQLRQQQIAANNAKNDEIKNWVIAGLVTAAAVVASVFTFGAAAAPSALAAAGAIGAAAGAAGQIVNAGVQTANDQNTINQNSGSK